MINKTALRQSAILFAAALIWGTSFFIMKNTLDVMPVFYLLAVRFTVGAGLLALVCWKKWREFPPDYLWRGAVIGGGSEHDFLPEDQGIWAKPEWE